MQQYVDLLLSAGVQIPAELGESRVLRFKASSEGVTYAVVASRDANGGVGNLLEFQATDASGATTTETLLNATDRRIDTGNFQITSVQHSDGSWTTEFFDRKLDNKYTHSSPAVAQRSLSAKKTMDSEVVALAEPQPSKTIPVQIRTRSCGIQKSVRDLYNLRVYLNDASGKYLGDYPAVEIGNGLYLAQLPDPGQDAAISFETVKTILKGAESQLTAACAADAQSPFASLGFCTSVGTGLALLIPELANFAAEATAACLKTVIDFKAACEAAALTQVPIPDEAGGAELTSSLAQIVINRIPDAINASATPVLSRYPDDLKGTPVPIVSGGTGKVTDIDDLSTCPNTFEYTSASLNVAGFKNGLPLPVPGPVRATITVNGPIHSTFSGELLPQQVTRVVLQSTDIQTVDIPATDLLGFQMKFLNGMPSVWTLSSGLVDIGQSCIARDATQFLAALPGSLSVVIATSNLQDAAFDRCIGTDPLRGTFTNTFRDGNAPGNPANWIAIPPPGTQ